MDVDAVAYWQHEPFLTYSPWAMPFLISSSLLMLDLAEKAFLRRGRK